MLTSFKCTEGERTKDTIWNCSGSYRSSSLNVFIWAHMYCVSAPWAGATLKMWYLGFSQTCKRREPLRVLNHVSFLWEAKEESILAFWHTHSFSSLKILHVYVLPIVARTRSVQRDLHDWSIYLLLIWFLVITVRLLSSDFFSLVRGSLVSYYSFYLFVLECAITSFVSLFFIQLLCIFLVLIVLSITQHFQLT